MVATLPLSFTPAPLPWIERGDWLAAVAYRLVVQGASAAVDSQVYLLGNDKLGRSNQNFVDPIK